MRRARTEQWLRGYRGWIRLQPSNQIRWVDRGLGIERLWPAQRAVAEHGLTPFEYEKLVAMLERTPTLTELGVISALWSEHCSYKHSRPVLKTLPTQAPWVLQGPGENAGVISIGDGLAVAF